MNVRRPDLVTAVLGEETVTLDHTLSFDGGCVTFTLDDALHVQLKSEKRGVSFLYLRWNEPLAEGLKVLGDAWERAYGDLAWLPIDGERVMPWYMAVSNGSDSVQDYAGRRTQCFGVGVRPNAMAHWQCDREGVTLTLDVRCGCLPVVLGERTLDVASVYMRDYEDVSAFTAVKDFCHVMSPKPLLADHVVYGSNNWYYAYGKSSEAEILSDTDLVLDLCKENESVPYMVIDDGWQPHGLNAPFDRTNERFSDMKSLAAEMKRRGVRPGIWVRYLVDGEESTGRHMNTFSEDCYSKRCRFALDPSHPDVLAYVRETTKRLIEEWGYELIKHDYSTYDIFGIWGFETKDLLAKGEWGFFDKTKTTAEIIKNFYVTVREAAGNTVIIGCNAIGHLCAGLHELNRTGDDTSGYDWERTKKMGVNTLAFRIVQNNAFFGADADCVGITGSIPWQYNAAWLKLLSRSGSCLFVSCKPDVPNESELADLRRGFAFGSRQADELIPLDWMETPTPTRYLINGEEVTFDWGKD